MRAIPISVAILAAAFAASASGEDAAQFTIVVQNGQFAPPQIRSTADAPFTLKVTNLDAAPVEFAIAGMRVDRMISPHTSVTMQIGALRRGRYSFSDVAHAATRGALIID